MYLKALINLKDAPLNMNVPQNDKAYTIHLAPHTLVKEAIPQVTDFLWQNTFSLTLFIIIFIGRWIFRNQIERRYAIQDLIRHVSTIDKDIYILDLLNQIRITTAADRVLLHQFHNPGRSISGLKFLKMTCTHESLAPGISSIANLYRQVLISDHCYDLPTLVQHASTRSFMKTDANSTLLSFKQRAHLDIIGVRHLYQQLLLDEDSPIALISVHFIGEGGITMDTTQVNDIVNIVTYNLLTV